jgi:hypothetical protein
LIRHKCCAPAHRRSECLLPSGLPCPATPPCLWCRGFEHCIANMYLIPLSMCLGSGISVGEHSKGGGLWG